MWHFSDSINLDEELSTNEKKEVLLHVQSLGHAALLFINKELAGLKSYFMSVVIMFSCFLQSGLDGSGIIIKLLL